MSETRTEREWKALTAHQRQAIWLIAQGYSYKDTARKVGKTAQTLARWRTIPEFRSSLRSLMLFYSDETYNRVNVALPPVIEGLRDIALNGERDSDRIAASKVLITSWSLLKESLDRDLVAELENRVAQIEQESRGDLEQLGYNEDKILRDLQDATQKELVALAERNEIVGGGA